LKHILTSAKYTTRLRATALPPHLQAKHGAGVVAFDATSASSSEHDDADTPSTHRTSRPRESDTLAASTHIGSIDHRGHRANVHGITPQEGASLVGQLQTYLRPWKALPSKIAHALRAAATTNVAGSITLDTASSALRSQDGSVSKVSVSEAPTFQLPNQENCLALVLDPFKDAVPFTFGVEVFPPGHQTPPHVHNTAYEMFFIVAGGGEAFCNGTRFRVGAGDTVVFPPGCEHGIDADEGGRKLYCLELMLPNEAFSEFVRAGQRMEGLDVDDMCVLAAIGCR
jgi:quercetin dioxygenase-like cupin family protein